MSDDWRPIAVNESRPAFSCPITNCEYQPGQIRQRVDFLSRAFAKVLDWHPSKGDEWGKVMGVFTLNTVSDTASFCATCTSSD